MSEHTTVTAPNGYVVYVPQGSTVYIYPSSDRRITRAIEALNANGPDTNHD